MNFENMSPAQAADEILEGWTTCDYIRSQIRDAIIYFSQKEVERKQKKLATVNEELRNLRARVANQRKQLARQGRLIQWQKDAIEAAMEEPDAA